MTEPEKVHRVSRWLSVRVCAFALRHGATVDDLMRALAAAYRCEHCRGAAWRQDIIGDALLRNARRLSRA